jgi:hypothetical protein
MNEDLKLNKNIFLYDISKNQKMKKNENEVLKYE